MHPLRALRGGEFAGFTQYKSIRQQAAQHHKSLFSGLDENFWVTFFASFLISLTLGFFLFYNQLFWRPKCWPVGKKVTATGKPIKRFAEYQLNLLKNTVKVCDTEDNSVDNAVLSIYVMCGCSEAWRDVPSVTFCLILAILVQLVVPLLALIGFVQQDEVVEVYDLCPQRAYTVDKIAAVILMLFVFVNCQESGYAAIEKFVMIKKMIWHWNATEEDWSGTRASIRSTEENSQRGLIQKKQLPTSGTAGDGIIHGYSDQDLEHDNEEGVATSTLWVTQKRPARHVIRFLNLAIVFKVFSVLLTVLLTYLLFIEDPSTADMMTNATAIYFITSVDTSVVLMLKYFRIPGWINCHLISHANLATIYGHWGKITHADDRMIAYFEANSYIEKWRRAPDLFLCRVFAFIFTVYAMTLSLVAGFCL